MQEHLNATKQKLKNKGHLEITALRGKFKN
jgi:hypothetical protein